MCRVFPLFFFFLLLYSDTKKGVDAMKMLLLYLISVLLAPAFAAAENGSYAWDALRPVSDVAVQLDAPIKWFVLLLSAALFVISLLAYAKSKSKRILIVSFAFLLFLVKAVIKVADIYFSPGAFFSYAADDAADFLIMLSIFMAIFYRRSGSKFFAKENAE